MAGTVSLSSHQFEIIAFHRSLHLILIRNGSHQGLFLRYDCPALDTMQIYGSDAETAAKLRSGEGGRLKGNAEKGEDALMPFDDVRQCPDMTAEEEGALVVSRNRSIESRCR